jgi:hypothetical protein
MIARITWDDKTYLTSIIVPGITIWYDRPPFFLTKLILNLEHIFFFYFFFVYTGTEIS